MAAIWRDINSSMNNEVYANNSNDFTFIWQFVTFSNETQEAAEVRWRKMGNAQIVASAGIRGLMNDDDAMWSAPISLGRLEDTTTWTLSGGQMVPPIDANRRYSNIVHVTFPIGHFYAGTWAIQVRMKPVGQEWSGWISHKIEINEYDDIQFYASSSSGQVKGPAFGNEGEYGIRVEVMSASGAVVTSAEQNFDVWQTDKYLHHSGGVQAIPESYHDGTMVVRGKRNT